MKSSSPIGGRRGGNTDDGVPRPPPPAPSSVIIPLVFVEVQPLVLVVGDDDDDASPAPPTAAESSKAAGRRRRRRTHQAESLSSGYVKLQLMRLSSSSSMSSELSRVGTGGASFASSELSPGGLNMDLDDDEESAIEAARDGSQDKIQEDRDDGGRSRRHREKPHQFASGDLWSGAASWKRGGDTPENPVRKAKPTISLESENPSELDPCHCYCRGYVEGMALQTATTAMTTSSEAKGHGQSHTRDSKDARTAGSTCCRAVVTDATLVHVLPPVTVSLASSPTVTPGTPRTPTYVASSSGGPSSFLCELVGESHDGDDPFLDTNDSDGESVLSCFNPDAVRQLTWRLSRMLFDTPKVELGSTRDAVTLQHRHRDRIRRLRFALDRRSSSSGNHCQDPVGESVEQQQRPRRHSTSPGLGQERMLLVHSPNHGEGKTMLVRALLHRLSSAQDSVGVGAHTTNGMLKPQRPRTQPRVLTRVLRLGPFLAKYGAYADVALETWVHCVAFQAAVRNLDAVCLVVDGLEALFLPPRASQGDAAVPAIQHVTAYLQLLSKSISYSSSFGAWDLQTSNQNLLSAPSEIPFPIKNRLYSAGSRGFVASIRFGVVTIATCADSVFSYSGGSTSARGEDRHVQNLAALFADRYRVPTSTTETRLRAFRDALRRERLVPSPELEDLLPGIAASATSVRGKAFGNVARHVQAIISSRARRGDGTVYNRDASVSVQDFRTALRLVGRLSTGVSSSSSLVHGIGNASCESPTGVNNLFPDVGGNRQAKVALEDALALDPARRRRLASIGMSPPTGIMLAGPPGTGKTMLAKAVASALRSTSTTASHVLPGAFITLSSSDLVRAEVGEGEKMVVQAFETARTNAPAVIFIDEFQALFTDRSSGGSSRMTTALLECMDELKTWAEVDSQSEATASNPGESYSTLSADWSAERRVVVLAATNTPWLVDKAFLRPGRFDRCVQVRLPTQAERHTILRLHVSKMKIAFRDEAESIEAVCHTLAASTEGFSGADLAALCRAAAVRCLLEKNDFVKESHLIAARELDVKPSSSSELVHRIENWKL